MSDAEAGLNRASSKKQLVIVASIVFFSISALLTAVSRGTFASYDGKLMLQVTENLIANGGIQTTYDEFGRNSPYSGTGLGMSLLLIPGYMTQLFADSITRIEPVVLTNVVVIAATGVVLFFLGHALSWGRSALLPPFMMAFFTMATVYAAELFTEPAVGLCLVMSVLGLVLWRRGHQWGPILAGSGFALGVLLRTDSLILLGSVLLALPLFVPVKRLLRLSREVVAFAIPVLAAAAWVALFNYIRWGSPLAYGYPGEGFTTDITFGTWTLLVSWGLGFFWYNPILVLALPGLFVLFRRDSALATAIFLGVIARPLFYSRWSGLQGLDWGPRYLVPMCALLVIPACELIRRAWKMNAITKVSVAFVTLVLLAVGLVVNIAGLWMPYERVMSDIATPPPGVTHEEWVPTGEKSQLNDYYFSIHGNHIARNLKYIMRGNPPEALAWFNGNVSPIGVGLLLVSVVASAGLFPIYSKLQKGRALVGDPQT